MKVQTLVSAVNQDVSQLVETMNLQTDSVVVNQCDRNEYGEFDTSSFHVKWECMDRRGVGLNRNTCIKHGKDGDILLFSDEDIVYDDGYEKRIIRAYEKNPDADAILFNMRVGQTRRTYWNNDEGRVRFYNYGRYPAYSISIRRDALEKSKVLFPLEFGGGSKYINGEDSIFLHDLLASKIKIYRSTECLGEETERESTWFKGYNEKFFISRGALYVRLYGHFDLIMAYVFLLRHKYMTDEMGFSKAIKLMKQGMKEMRRQ